MDRSLSFDRAIRLTSTRWIGTRIRDRIRVEFDAFDSAVDSFAKIRVEFDSFDSIDRSIDRVESHFENTTGRAVAPPSPSTPESTSPRVPKDVPRDRRRRSTSRVERPDRSGAMRARSGLGLYDDVPRARAIARQREDVDALNAIVIDIDIDVSDVSEVRRVNTDAPREDARPKASVHARDALANALRAKRKRACEWARDVERRHGIRRQHTTTTTTTSTTHDGEGEGKVGKQNRKGDRRTAEAEATTTSDAEMRANGDEIEETYDVDVPNDYEATVEQRKARAREERRAMRAEDEIGRLEAMRRDVEGGRAIDREKERDKVLGVSGREARARREGISWGGANARGGVSANANANAPSAAEKMMAKMGWSIGKGLGKSEQGMATPLEVKKDGVATGKIVNAPLLAASAGGLGNGRGASSSTPASVGGLGNGLSASSSIPDSAAPTPLRGKPTRVLLLRNVVGPGEVDEALEDEIANECEKYAPVVRALIFEITEQDFPEDEAVRVFVEFTDVEGAKRAGMALNRRYFAKRLVKASFYDESNFANENFGPQMGED